MPGCSFLKSKEVGMSGEDQEETLQESESEDYDDGEDEEEDEDEDEESEDYDDGEEDDEDYDEEEEEDADEDEDMEEAGEEDYDDEEDEEEDSKGGFFQNLFGGADDDEEDEDSEEDYDESEATADLEASTTYETKQSSFIPVKKIKTQTYYKQGLLVNAVYIARPGDNMRSISEKIYSRDQKEQLYTINPHFKNRTLKPGDKIYYSSPNRKTDSQNLLFYYEDEGFAASYYTAKQGQNIRDISTSLLGNPNSWKEIWATNPNLKSKGLLEETIEVKYWPNNLKKSQPEQEVQPLEELAPVEEVPSPEASLPEEEAPFEEPPQEVKPMPTQQDKPKTKLQPQGFMEQAQSLLKRNPNYMYGLAGFVLLLLLLIKKIVSRIRNKQEEFDYTNTSIDI